MKTELSNEYAKNASNIQLSDETKMLLICLAQLNDVLTNISEILENVFDENAVDTLIETFRDTKVNLDCELIKIIGVVIDSNAFDSNFAKF